ncbi:putative ABC transport system permease protein [Desulfitobacterium sp. LBE]|uniref:ABC transporter permease n=1 Tax=Desulfitobacterium sp. LBE TaxID=884086 RepID=UPI00119B0634|nr:ABC transporter permease [Desulfitobacterium sp. LBE]TWH56968.1 putative ABC transport system permease protein [Desulfitobacterium sp. LBE]
MIKVKNNKAIRTLAERNFRTAGTRNVIAVIAIALTAILFTSVFTMGFGLVESIQRASMIMSGGDGHAAVKYVTDEEYERIKEHPLVKEMAYCRIMSDSVDNQALIRRHTEFWYYDDVGLKYGFAEPTGGHKPQAENEVIADTKTLELLGVPLEVGAPLTLEITVHGRRVLRDFILAGWWESDPGFNIGQIFASRAYLDAYSEELHYTYPEDKSLTGTITGYIKFANSLGIAENLEKVVTESGFSMEEGDSNYLATGVNWAYLSTGVGMDAGTVTALASALLLFVLTGYLIIYNIFQISVLRDIRFYGLLKTIGTTGRQLRAIIRRQVLRLSLIGIPLGLLAGFLVGKALVPYLMERSSYAGSRVSVSPDPLIFAGAALFALFTVWISAHKPGKMAARISPVEAMRYTDQERGSGKKLKKSRHGAKPWRMALANLGRNKRRTVLVVLSLSLSIVLTNTVFTISQSVDLNKGLEKFSDSDFLLGHANLFNHQYDGESSALSESFISAAGAQEGFETGGRLYGSWASYQSGTSAQTMNQQPDGSLATALYGLEEFPFSRLKLVDGELDREKLAGGDYVLEGVQADDQGKVETGRFNHQVGDKITLNYGSTEREMTVLGHVVANPQTNTDGSWRGSAFFLPADIYRELTGNSFPMSYAFNVAEAQERDLENFLKRYTAEVEPTMNYSSKFTALSSLEGLRNTAVLIGGSLAAIIGLIGVLNFVNAVLTGILTRHRELAMLQSIGMTRRQLVGMLCSEGGCYAALTGISSILLSVGFSLLILRPLSEQIWFLSYRFVFWPLLIILPLLFVLGALVPYIVYYATAKQSIVERLRMAE